MLVVTNWICKCFYLHLFLTLFTIQPEDEDLFCSLERDHWWMCSSLLGSQGLEEKPNSPLKAIKAAVFCFGTSGLQSNYSNGCASKSEQKADGEEELCCTAQFWSNHIWWHQTDPGLAQHCWHSWVRAQGKLQGNSWWQRTAAKPQVVPVTWEQRGLSVLHPIFQWKKAHHSGPDPSRWTIT